MVKHNTIKLELEASVNTIGNLIDNETITSEEGRELLSQFKKDDLITAILDRGFDGIEDDEEDGEDESLEEEDEEDAIVDVESKEVVNKTLSSSDEIITDLVEDVEDDFEGVLD